MARRHTTELREDYTVRFPIGTLARLERILKGSRDSKAEFIRQAVEERLQHAERQRQAK